MISKVIGLIICLVSLLLPWRLRVLFSEFLGWVTQTIYYTYYGILNFLLKELKSDQEKSSEIKKGDGV
jgi:hypothetical protein